MSLAYCPTLCSSTGRRTPKFYTVYSNNWTSALDVFTRAGATITLLYLVASGCFSYECVRCFAQISVSSPISAPSQTLSLRTQRHDLCEDRNSSANSTF